MKQARLVVAILILGAAIALVVWRTRPPRPHAQSAGADEVSERLAPLASAMAAPDGGTPCETAYIALVALDDAAHQMNKPTPWKKLVDRPTFLGRCAALPEQDQLCLQPRYDAWHHDVCDRILDRYTPDNPLFSAGP